MYIISWTLYCNRRSKRKSKTALPRPRYGRYIPEGSPPKTPKILSPEFPFQSERPSAELYQSYHNEMRGSGDERWAEVEARSKMGQEETAWSQREGAATADGDRSEGTVDDFREKVTGEMLL